MRPGVSGGTLDPMALDALIVDDNEHFLVSASALLEREGLCVATASTWDEALTQVRERRPDVVLIDLNLGSVSGLALATALTSAVAEAPAMILISSESSDDVRDLLLGSPVRGFLSKLDLSAQAIESILGS
jgi:CheY-like chemotaxis protein